MASRTVIAGVELGGTKSIAVLAEGSRITHRFAVPTTSPESTLAALCDQLTVWRDSVGFSALGIATFGPVQLSAESKTFGRILATPKPLWTDAAVTETLTSSFAVPWRIDTDVNGAALAEHRWGAGVGCDVLCYVTIGTGLGGGIVVQGRTIQGSMHPEIGHLHLRRAPGDTFAGVCPFHGDCVEGLVSGPALAKRFDNDPKLVPDSHPGWQHVAADLAELAGSILLSVSPRRILFGGSVSTSRPALLPQVRVLLVRRLASYLPFLTPETAEDIVRHPALGSDAGPLGAVALGADALAEGFG